MIGIKIEIIIDELTECLLHSETGKEYETEYWLVKESITKEEALRLNKNGWKFDWSEPQQKGYEVYELHIKGDTKVQGMIAFKHINSQYYTHVHIVEAAPCNVGKNGEYKGVGAHLFAIACKHSWLEGNSGYVQFKAKTKLIEHYIATLNAKCIGDNNLYIDTNGALALIKKYFKES